MLSLKLVYVDYGCNEMEMWAVEKRNDTKSFFVTEYVSRGV